ncbi:MAG: amino acid adenylation domain-containing protein, partial [Thermomicrobiales bacterium]|nr:amino acid adenylation domain-containing protein [Thermomicrobiales bacterium]
SLSLWQGLDEIEGWFEYSTDLFRADTIARMAQHFAVLLEAIVADPEQPITALPLLTAVERHTMLVEWNATSIPLPDQTLPDLFAAQVQRTPDAIALVDGAEQLSYRQLDQRANQLAHHLQQLGVSPEIPVALCLEQSTDLLISVLAILKAGGVYVPLDPSQPAARLALLLADTAAPILLAHRSLRDRIPAGEQKRIWLESIWPDIASYPTTPPEHQTTPDNLAYIIYTSGSTGMPKGVMVEHRSVVRLVINTDYLQLNPTEVVAHASNPAFDALTFELWGTWLNGARLVLLPQDVLLTPPALAEWLEHHQITTIFLTTSLFHQIARDQPATLQTLRHLLIGGEACDPQPVNAFMANGYSTRLLNVYGPTETTTFATSYAISAKDAGAATIPIGRPIANTTAYVLDTHLQPVPIGVPGELYIGGAGVARGYLNRPDLTAERFLPDPFKPDPAARLYRTGDLVRYRPDGNLEFLGRIDQQIKLRGYRIELGEIEAVLSRHPAVQAGVVLLREDRPGERRIVAYVVLRAATEISIGSLRGYLNERLPDYMLPAAVIPIERFPLTPNGKLDRQALPAPDRTGMIEEVDSVAPRTSFERQLVQIWEDLLGVSPIGVRDNFFDLGGHSLLVVRLFSRIQRDFGVELPLAALFPEATVERLALLIEQPDPPAASSSLVPIQPNGTKPPFFCVHSIDGDVLRFAALARFLGDDQPFYGLRAQGLEGTLSPLADVKEIAATYIAEIRRIQPVGPYFLGGYSGGGMIAFEMARQLQQGNAHVALLAIIDHLPVGSPREKAWGEALTPGNSLQYLRGNATYCLKMLRESRKQRNAWLRSLVSTAGDWVTLTNRRMRSHESQTNNLPWRIRWLVEHL